MKITVLGMEGPFPSEGGATSGYLLSLAGGAVSVDMGSGVFASLRKYCQPEKVLFVVLSHLHFDHMSDLGVYNYYLEFLAKRGAFAGQIPCYLPPVDEESFAFLQKRYPYFAFSRLQEGTYALGGATFRFYKMNHPVLTYGFTAEEGGKTIAYTGDTNLCGNVYKMAQAADLMLLDGLFTGAGHSEKLPHLSASLAADIAKEGGARGIITHLSPFTPREAYEKEVQGKAEVVRRFAVYEP